MNALPLLVGLALRLVNLWAPILGVHSWRQADTAAMARHFAREGMVFWLPQIDWAGAGPGYVESEFPLYPYAVALLYRLFGIHEWLARGLSVVFGVLTIAVVMRIGRDLLGERAGWWGGMLMAVLPIGVYYGRTVQPEALMMLLAAVALERLLAWGRTRRPRDLLLSWLGFSGACLVKVLPLVWLGLPLFWLWGHLNQWRLLRRPATWLYSLATVALMVLWYRHAYQLGMSTGLSFGFWGGDADRYDWGLLLNIRSWADLMIRITVRNLAVVGLPLLILGLCDPAPRDPRTRLLPIGLVSVLLAGALAPESSFVHEYYQLPLLLFACPLMGSGLMRVQKLWPGRPQRLSAVVIGLTVAISLTVLSLDYWRLERARGSATWQLAQEIRSKTTPSTRIVSVTGSDPTLLYLSDRRGWLVSPSRLLRRSPQEWHERGAGAIAGSLSMVESFQPFADGERKNELKAWLTTQGKIDDPSEHYVLRLPLEP